MCSPGLTRLTERDGHGWMGACRQGQVTNRLIRVRTTPAMGIIGEPWRILRTRPAARCRISDQQRPGQFRRNGCPISTEALRSCVEQTERLASGEGVIERTSQSECWPERRLNSRDTAGSESPRRADLNSSRTVTPQSGARSKKKRYRAGPKAFPVPLFRVYRSMLLPEGFSRPPVLSQRMQAGYQPHAGGGIPSSGSSSRHGTQITVTSLRSVIRCITRTTPAISTTGTTGPALNHTQIHLKKHFTTHPPAAPAIDRRTIVKHSEQTDYPKCFSTETQFRTAPGTGPIHFETMRLFGH